MKTYEITDEKVKAALSVAKSNEVKDVLNALFCEGSANLYDYKSIKTYEDACEALGETNVEFDKSVPKHIAALMKLETISKALWGKTFQPKPDAKGSDYYYYPWFALYTKEEIEDMDDDDKGALLSATATDGAGAGFGTLITDNRSSFAIAHLGFRLCQETEERAAYFGKQFIKLWAEYTVFNFTTGDHLK